MKNIDTVAMKISVVKPASKILYPETLICVFQCLQSTLSLMWKCIKYTSSHSKLLPDYCIITSYFENMEGIIFTDTGRIFVNVTTFGWDGSHICHIILS